MAGLTRKVVPLIPWIWFDHRTDLPKWLTSAIGQVAVEWSALERELEELNRLLMDVELKIGRMATTGMNVRTRLLVAKNFIQASPSRCRQEQREPGAQHRDKREAREFGFRCGHGLPPCGGRSRVYRKSY